MKNKKIIYLASTALILLALGIGFLLTQPVSVLTVDVNPSIQLVTNRLDKVIEIKPLNDDARELLKDFEPEDKDLEDTVNDLVDLMILTGHIKGGQDNYVMITVDDETVDSELVDRVNRAIQAMLENKQIEATVLNQAIARKNKEENLTGVQMAARKLQDVDGSLTIEEIESMTVKELVSYSQEKNIPIEKLFNVVTGDLGNVTGERSIISKEEAKQIAFNKVNGEIIKLEVDDLGDNPEYDVEIISNGIKYELEIDAYTGKIVEFEKNDDYNGEVNKLESNDDDDDDKSVSNTSTKKKQNSRKKISTQEAKSIALSKVKNGKIIEFEKDDDEYQVEIISGGIKYEIEINAYTGKIVEFEIDDDYEDVKKLEKDDDANKQVSNSSIKSNKISAQKAKSIALGLVENGKIIEFESDDDEYEIEIIANGKEYDIEVCAFTGKVLDFDVENDN